MFAWGEFIHACISTYMYVFGCICLYLRQCLYLNPIQTEICWNACKHVFVCICMYHMYMYIYARNSMYVYVYACMCIYVYLCSLYTTDMLICKCQAAVAQWRIQAHMTVQTGIRTPTTTKAFCFRTRTDFLLLGKFI